MSWQPHRVRLRCRCRGQRISSPRLAPSLNSKQQTVVASPTVCPSPPLSTIVSAYCSHQSVAHNLHLLLPYLHLNFHAALESTTLVYFTGWFTKPSLPSSDHPSIPSSSSIQRTKLIAENFQSASPIHSTTYQLTSHGTFPEPGISLDLLC